MSSPRSVPWRAGIAAVLLAASASAQVSGVIALPDCSGVDAAAGTQGELLLVGGRIPGSVEAIFDLRAKGGLAAEGTSLGPEGFASRADIPFAFPPSLAVLVALPPATPLDPGRLVLVSAFDIGGSVGALIPLTVGDSLAPGVDAGIGLRIAPGGSYAVDFGASVRSYPQRDSDGSVTLAFAPLAESGFRLGDACRLSGWQQGARPAGPSVILGYAVYRVLSPAGIPPAPGSFAAALTDGDPATGYVGLVDLRKFRFSVATDVTVDPAANDLDLADGASLHDPDGRMYSGDEVILWTDAATGPRAHPLRAPRPGSDYSYAVQPVTFGSLSTLRPCYTPNCILDGDHLRDLDGNGANDAVDLDGLSDASLDVEFISPQADPSEGSLDGLGLTFRSNLLLSATMTAPETPVVLRRSTDVTALSPLTPPLSSFLPLGTSDDHVVPFASGDVDPDPAVIESSAYPLVFYEVPGQDDLMASVTGAPGSRRVRFTF